MSGISQEVHFDIVAIPVVGTCDANAPIQSDPSDPLANLPANIDVATLSAEAKKQLINAIVS